MMKAKASKMHLTKEEEFQVFKLVIDKFLWIGTIMLLYGIFLLLNKDSDVTQALIVSGIGALFLLLFTSIVVGNMNYKKAE